MGRYIVFLPVKFGETLFELENPRLQKEGHFRRVDKTFFPLGSGSTRGEACRFSVAHDAVFRDFPRATADTLYMLRKFFFCKRGIFNMLRISIVRVFASQGARKFFLPTHPSLKGGVGAILRVAVCYSMDGSSGARPSKTPDRTGMKTKECERLSFLEILCLD